MNVVEWGGSGGGVEVEVGWRWKRNLGDPKVGRGVECKLEVAWK